MSKIKNVVFDFGQVIVHFYPEKIIRRYPVADEDVPLLLDVIFSTPRWSILDTGTMTEEEYANDCFPMLPERLHAVTKEILQNWYHFLPLVDGMEDLIRNLKDRASVKVFLLSNISRNFAAHAKEFPIFDLFDGCVFSGPIRMVKPSPEIFRYLCDTYGLLPEESVFIDDNANNVQGAINCGFSAYRFDKNVKELTAYLEKTLGVSLTNEVRNVPFSALKMTAGKILGVDFGDVRTGLAESDASRFLASGIGYVSPGGIEKTADAVAEIAKEKRIGAIVVGLPRNMDGSEGSRAGRCREFAELLRERLPGTVVTMVDERLTTVSASRYLNETNVRGAKRKGVIDTLSAQIILQNALDRLKNI